MTCSAKGRRLVFEYQDYEDEVVLLRQWRLPLAVNTSARAHVHNYVRGLDGGMVPYVKAPWALGCEDTGLGSSTGRRSSPPSPSCSLYSLGQQ